MKYVYFVSYAFKERGRKSRLWEQGKCEWTRTEEITGINDLDQMEKMIKADLELRNPSKSFKVVVTNYQLLRRDDERTN